VRILRGSHSCDRAFRGGTKVLSEIDSSINIFHSDGTLKNICAKQGLWSGTESNVKLGESGRFVVYRKEHTTCDLVLKFGKRSQEEGSITT
jgi:hypothetical protein